MEVNWESPAYGGNASFMSTCWLMAMQKEIVEGKMKQYFPFHYRMMKLYNV